jgi:hypothetical protein
VKHARHCTLARARLETTDQNFARKGIARFA